MADHYESEALRQLTNASRGPYESAPTFAIAAVANAVLSLAKAQREATEWGKEQVLLMREQQTQFLADLKASLDD